MDADLASGIEASIGAQVRSVRLLQSQPQSELATRAGISLRSLRDLESGRGTTLRTLIHVLGALDQEGWLHTLAAHAEADEGGMASRGMASTGPP